MYGVVELYSRGVVVVLSCGVVDVWSCGFVEWRSGACVYLLNCGVISL